MCMSRPTPHSWEWGELEGVCGVGCKPPRSLSNEKHLLWPRVPGWPRSEQVSQGSSVINENCHRGFAGNRGGNQSINEAKGKRNKRQFRITLGVCTVTWLFCSHQTIQFHWLPVLAAGSRSVQVGYDESACFSEWFSSSPRLIYLLGTYYIIGPIKSSSCFAPAAGRRALKLNNAVGSVSLSLRR